MFFTSCHRQAWHIFVRVLGRKSLTAIVLWGCHARRRPFAAFDAKKFKMEDFWSANATLVTLFAGQNCFDDQATTSDFLSQQPPSGDSKSSDTPDLSAASTPVFQPALPPADRSPGRNLSGPPLPCTAVVHRNPQGFMS